MQYIRILKQGKFILEEQYLLMEIIIVQNVIKASMFYKNI